LALDRSLLLVDSHCHLDAAQFDEDRPAVIERARAAGVERIVIPGIDLQQCRQAMTLLEAALLEAAPAEAHESLLYLAMGVHPNSSGDFNAAAESELRQLAHHAKVVAIGEIGLDYYWDKVDPARQRLAFERQLDIAAELALPVIIHSRDANADVAAVLSEWVSSQTFAASPLAKRPFAGVLHAFSGDVAMAQAAYSWNFLLSLGGPVTFTNAKQLHALVPQLRRDRLMLETDAPYLTPHPQRGKRNEPAYITLVCEKLAALYGIPATQVAAESSALALTFFGLSPLQATPGSTAAASVQHAVNQP
jgi:TatD DNase family protein